jgi:putative transposase
MKLARTVVAKRPGRPPIFTVSDEAFLLERVATDPHLSTRTLADEMTERLGRPMNSKTIGNALRRLRVKKVRPKTAPKLPPARRYGYTKAHRREPTETRYPSDLTAVEWALVADLFEHKGPGRPEKHPRRRVLEAMSYVIRSGCAWRLLPKEFPPWALVYMTFRRWSEAGLFETMNDRLRALWREREGRAEAPTAAIIDSQSVKTSEKGGSTVSTRARRSKAASATSSRTRAVT